MIYFQSCKIKLKKKEYNIKKGENSLLIYFNIKNIPDFFLTIKKSEASLNSTVDSLCQLVNKLISDNKNMQKEIKELKNEIINLKNDVKELKQEKEEREKKEKEKEEMEKKERKKVMESDILENKEEKLMVCNWIKLNTKIKFNLIYYIKSLEMEIEFQHLQKK